MDTFKKQLGVQLAIACAVVAVAVLLTQLAAGDLKKNSISIQNQKTELALRIRATDQLASLKSDFEKAKPLFEVLNSILPAKDDLINFGQAMTSLAKTDHVDLNFSFGGEAPPANQVPGFIKFSISGTSSYPNFEKFLKDLAKSRYFIKINSVDLTRQPAGENYAILADGQVFYQ